MAGLVPAIHVFAAKTRMPGTRLRQGFTGPGIRLAGVALAKPARPGMTSGGIDVQHYGRPGGDADHQISPNGRPSHHRDTVDLDIEWPGPFGNADIDARGRI